MRSHAICLMMALSITGSTAQEKQDLPPLHIEGVAGPENCVDVEVGQTRTYDCLNDKLKRKKDSVVPLPNVPPIDVHSTDIKKGIINVPAVRQQYGPNFGKSAVPYRPPAPTYKPLHPDPH
jgi:hypothetical protein